VKREITGKTPKEAPESLITRNNTVNRGFREPHNPGITLEERLPRAYKPGITLEERLPRAS